MTNILQIRSSSNLKTSTSRRLGDEIISKLQKLYPNARTIVRDLALEPLSLLTPDLLEQMMAGDNNSEFYKTSNLLIDELNQSDILVIESPMYNYTIPATLKTWFDYTMIARKTFKYTATGVEGLVANKKTYLALARGGDYSAPEKALYEHQESYLRAVLSHIGITNVDSIIAQGLAMGADAAEKSVQDALQKINLISLSI